MFTDVGRTGLPPWPLLKSGETLVQKLITAHILTLIVILGKLLLLFLLLGISLQGESFLQSDISYFLSGNGRCTCTLSCLSFWNLLWYEEVIMLFGCHLFAHRSFPLELCRVIPLNFGLLYLRLRSCMGLVLTRYAGYIGIGGCHLQATFWPVLFRVLSSFNLALLSPAFLHLALLIQLIDDRAWVWMPPSWSSCLSLKRCNFDMMKAFMLLCCARSRSPGRIVLNELHRLVYGFPPAPNSRFKILLVGSHALNQIEALPVVFLLHINLLIHDCAFLLQLLNVSHPNLHNLLSRLLLNFPAFFLTFG